VGLLKVNWLCKINIDRSKYPWQDYSSWSSKPFTLYSHWIPYKVPEYDPRRDANVRGVTIHIPAIQFDFDYCLSISIISIRLCKSCFLILIT